MQAFTRAIEKDPEHALAVIRRGLAYYRLGEYRKAISDYDRAIELKRYQADAYYSRGDAYRELGDYQQAIADYTASIEERWAAFVVWRRAETYLQIGDERARACGLYRRYPAQGRRGRILSAGTSLYAAT